MLYLATFMMEEVKVNIFFFFVNPNKKFNLISWQSKRIKRMVCSSLAAEVLAMLGGIYCSIIEQINL